MFRVLFVCHGNICRSPMAEFVLKYIVRNRGIEKDFYIDSAATSNEEIGRTPYYGTLDKLREEGVPAHKHIAVQITRADYRDYDYILCMDTYNIRDLMRMFSNDPERKVSRLLDFTDNPHDIADPWYTRDFDTAYREIMEGCEAFLSHLGY